MARLSRLLIAVAVSVAALSVPSLAHAADTGAYVVRAGDSLSVIATRLDVPLADLLRANNLTVNSLILPGQRLVVPGASGGGSSGGSGRTRYTVRAGDWLSKIASRHGITLNTLLAANGLTATSLIMPGQQLTIPGSASGGGGGASSGGGSSGGSGGTTYTVKAGDWLSRIASRHGVTLTALLNANNLSANSLIVPGQRLQIPGTGGGGSGGGGTGGGTGGGGGTPSPPPGRPAAGPAYTVRPGDSLGGISTQHGVTLGALLAVNGLSSGSLITPGMQIKLPAGAKLTPADRVLNYALAQVGKPYKFWTRGPDFFDCSGLTVAAYAQIGISLIHHSASQAMQGVAVDFTTQPIRAGDLVFQDTDGDGIINHVGIALNDSTWVQARSTRGAVTYGMTPPDSRIVAVRRLLPAR